MKANELMLGDLVLCDGKPYRIAEIGGMVCLDYEKELFAALEDIEPIPLTAEILGKNKFSKSRLMGEQRHFTYYLAPSVSLLAIYDADFSLHIGDSARYIKYVHELQHALRLCGIEKEIEL